MSTLKCYLPFSIYLLNLQSHCLFPSGIARTYHTAQNSLDPGLLNLDEYLAWAP